MVLFAVIVECSLSSISKVSHSTDPWINSEPIETTRDMPNQYFVLKNSSHIVVIVGTFVWGYYDLFIQDIFKLN